MNNNVDHPHHYKESCSLECIEVMCLAYGKKIVHGFCLCNAFKYLWRFASKNGKEDLEKADWYLSYVEKDLNETKLKYSGVGYIANRVSDLRQLLKEVVDKEEIK